MKTQALETTQAKTPKIPNKKRQRMFIQAYYDPKSSTYGNAYESAKQAGFSDSTSRVITGNVRGLQWVQEAKNLYAASLSPAHIVQAFQQEALNAKYSRDRQSALDKLAKIHGLYIDRSESEVTVRFVNSVPRPIIEAELNESPPNPSIKHLDNIVEEQ